MQPITLNDLVDLVFAMHYNYDINHESSFKYIDPCTQNEISNNLENPIAPPVGSYDKLPIYQVLLESHHTLDQQPHEIRYSLIKQDDQPTQFFIHN